MKKIIAKILNLFFIIDLIWSIFHLFYGKNYIRVINYHSTNKENNQNFEKHLKYYQKKYFNVSYADLELFFENKKWHKNKPGLIISFDDGFRTNYDYGLPLIERYDFTGYFFIPSDFVFKNFESQNKFMNDNNTKKEGKYKDGRYSISWEELKLMSKNHVIGSHTRTHYRFKKTDNDKLVSDEIINSKKILEKNLKINIKCFAWVGGEFHTYTKKAYKFVADTYKYSFMTNTFPILPKTNPLWIQRTNIETFDTVDILKFQLCGLMDLYYYKKRTKLKQKMT